MTNPFACIANDIARTGAPHATQNIAGLRQQIIQALKTPPTPRGLF